MKSFTFMTILFVIYFAFHQEAYAYLDPGTGSYILQMIVAALLGGLFAVKLLWSKIKNVLEKFILRKREL